MEPGSLIGLVLVLVGIFLGAMLHGVNPTFLATNVPALLVVVVGSLGATTMSFRFMDTKSVFKVILKSFRAGPAPDLSGMLLLIVRLSQKARKDGVLALEAEAKTLDNTFLKKGLQLAIDGIDPEVVDSVLEADIARMRVRHSTGAAWLEKAGTFSPTFGIIGAVIGLIATLGHLNDPAHLGEGIAAAFVATFWGVFLANGVFLPLSGKLKRLSSEEVAEMQMLVAGILAIQASQNPSVLEETLISFLTPRQQADYRAERGK